MMTYGLWSAFPELAMANVPPAFMETAGEVLLGLADVFQRAGGPPGSAQVVPFDDDAGGWRSLFAFVEQPPNTASNPLDVPTMLVVELV
jgi:hypothetical protein